MSQNRRRILVAGAAGAVGEGICAALLDAGHEVHGLDRDAEGLTRLTETLSHGGHLHPHAVELTQPPMLASLVDELFSLEMPPSAVVSCLGRFWNKGHLCDQEYPQELHGVMHSSLVPHLILARHTVPRLRAIEGARYLFINGAWEPHVLTARTNPAWRPTPGLLLRDDDGRIAEVPTGRRP